MTGFRNFVLGFIGSQTVLHAHLDPSLCSTRVAPLQSATRLEDLVSCKGLASLDGTHNS